MSDILIRNVDAAVVAQLEARARRHGLSLQAELKLIMEQAAQPEPVRIPKPEFRALADQIRAAVAGPPQSDSASLRAEDRER